MQDDASGRSVNNRRITVRHVVRTLDVGGLEMVVLNLARHCDRERFDVGVICMGGPGELAPRFTEHGIPVESLHASGVVSGIVALVRHLGRQRADVLHTHNPNPHLVGSVAARLARVPVVVHTKHGRNRPHVRTAVLLNRFASRLTNMVVSVSEDAAEVARKVEGVADRKVVVIHNGIDLSGLGFADARGHATSPRAVCVARLDAIKDHPTLLRAVRRVVDARADFSLDLVGEGPDRPRIEQLVRLLRLEHHVRLRGHQDDVRPFLAGASVFVLASVSEGIALTLLEAMAVGLPVVATDVGGNREVVEHGQTGLLVPAGSSQGLSDAILAVLADPARAASMGSRGRLRVEGLFNLRSMVAQYEALYSRLLGRHRRNHTSLDHS